MRSLANQIGLHGQGEEFDEDSKFREGSGHKSSMPPLRIEVSSGCDHDDAEDCEVDLRCCCHGHRGLAQQMLQESQIGRTDS